MISLTTIGNVGKAVGISGFLKLHLDIDLPEDLKVLFIQFKGDRIPYFIERTDDENDLMIKFESINSPEEAKEIIGAEVFIETEYLDPNSSDLYDTDMLVEFEVYDQEKSLGKVVRIDQYPEQSMLVLAIEDQEILIPLVEDFIVNVDFEHRRIDLNLPEGIVESQM